MWAVIWLGTIWPSHRWYSSLLKKMIIIINFRLNGHLLGWKPCKLLNAIALGQIKAMNKKTAFTAGLK